MSKFPRETAYQRSKHQRAGVYSVDAPSGKSPRARTLGSDQGTDGGTPEQHQVPLDMGAQPETPFLDSPLQFRLIHATIS